MKWNNFQKFYHSESLEKSQWNDFCILFLVFFLISKLDLGIRTPIIGKFTIFNENDKKNYILLSYTHLLNYAYIRTLYTYVYVLCGIVRVSWLKADNFYIFLTICCYCCCCCCCYDNIIVIVFVFIWSVERRVP